MDVENITGMEAPQFELRTTQTKKMPLAFMGARGTGCTPAISTLASLVLSAAVLLTVHALAGADSVQPMMCALAIATLIAAVFAYPASRYIAETPDTDEEGRIGTCTRGVLILSGIVSGIVMLGACLIMCTAYGVSTGLAVACYFAGVLATCTYVLMTCSLATHNYIAPIVNCLGGLIAALCIYALCVQGFGAGSDLASATAVAGGFGLTAAFLVYQFAKTHVAPHGGAFGFTEYLKRQPGLCVAGLLLVLGVFAPGLIYRFFIPAQAVAGYDTCLFLATVMSAPSLAIFPWRMEKMLDKELIAFAHSSDTTKEQRGERARSIWKGLLTVCVSQLIITAAFVGIARAFLPAFGAGEEIFTTLVILALGMWIVFSMYYTLAPFYILENSRAAGISGIIFLAVTVIAAAIMASVAAPGALYAAPIALGGICGCAIAALQLNRGLHSPTAAR